MKLNQFKSILYTIAINILILFVCLFLVDLSILGYSKSTTLQKSIQLSQFFREFIKFNIVDIIQYKEECSKFDRELFYTLRPGHCQFNISENREEYSINSLGVRDDEESLTKPSIVFLGDSFTMGWGVSQTESFPSLIERATGQRALNAGISSYGTAREIKLLERIDTSNLKYLVIQYCLNDDEENNTFISNKNQLKVSDEKKYSETIKSQKEKQSYYPFKYLLEMYKILQENSAVNKEYAKSMKQLKYTNFDRNKIDENFHWGEVEVEFSYSQGENRFLHLQGWAYDLSQREPIESMGFFVNGKEVLSATKLLVDRPDLFARLRAMNIGWSSEISLPKDISEIEIEVLIKNKSGKVNILKYKNQTKIVLPKKPHKAETFLKVLSSFPKPLKDVNLIVTVVNGSFDPKYDFLSKINELKNSPEFPDYIKNIQTVEVQSSFDTNDFLRVDDHINASGHKKVADKILNLMK